MKRVSLTLATSLIALALLLSSCGTAATSGEGGNIAISGAFALYPMVTRWAEEYQRVQPGVTFDISGGGAGKGMTDALAGAVDIGMVSRDVKLEEAALGAYGIAVVKDGVFPMVNAHNPVIDDITSRGITQETFAKIYITGEFTTWGQVVGRPEITDEIHVYTRADSAGAAEMWARFLGVQAQEELLGIGVNADPGLLQAVLEDPLGIGYNNLSYAFEASTGLPVVGVLAAPIDLNQDGVADDDEVAANKTIAVELIATGKYPSPPARDLYLVTKGKPTGLTQAFIEWVLTEGQRFVGESGYVQLTPAQLETSLLLVR